MSVDLLTLSIALNLANLLQSAALTGLALANRDRVGPVWWAAGMGVLAAGLILTTLRDVALLALELHAISNALVGIGMLLLHYGVCRFFGDSGGRRWFWLAGGLIVAANLMLAFTGDAPPLRRILFSVVVALVSMLIARRLLRELRTDTRPVVLFLAIVFLVNSTFFALRAVASVAESDWLTVSPPWQTATYLVAIATTTLWTFGLILLVNQELVNRQHEAVQQLEQIFAAQPDAVLLSRLADGVFVKVNHGFTTISGYSADEAIGKDALTLNIWRSPEDRRRWAEIMRREGACTGMEFDFRRRDGTFRTCLLSSKVVMIRGVPHAISVVHDISERKRMEEALRRSDARYRLIAENTTDVIWLYDPFKSQFTFFSPSIEKLIGYSAAEALDLPLSAFLKPDSIQHVKTALDYMLHEWEGELTNAPPWTAEIDLIHRDGRIVQAEIVTSFVRDEEGQLMVLGVARDITARKQTEIELRLARQQAEAANRAKSAFLANVSHELRTPLHAVLGFAQLMSRDDNLTATQHEYLTIINRNSEHLLHLINEVLDLAKIESGRYTYTPNPLDVRRLLADLQALFGPQAEAKQLQLIVTCEEQVPPMIVSDEAKIRHILINLLGNAIKFTHSGSVRLRAATDKQQMYFVVEDTGVGISPLEQPYLFRPFFQGKQTANASSDTGVGLGLSISYEFARLIGGDLSVYSAGEGQGARFTLTLPLRTPVTSSFALPAEPVKRAIQVRADQQVYRMLVADDQPAHALLLISLLRRLGFAVQSVTDGEAALAVWREWQPHMIWLDLRMPQMDGLTVARQIRAICATEPGLLQPVIIALSAHVLGDTAASVLAAGCDEFLAKPFPEHEVVRLIEQHLRVQFEYVSAVIREIPETAIHDQGYHPAWCQALRQAVQVAHFQRLQELVAMIEDQRPDDARQLRNWIEAFDYEAVRQWLDRLVSSQTVDRVV